MKLVETDFQVSTNSVVNYSVVIIVARNGIILEKMAKTENRLIRLDVILTMNLDVP